ncbi:hypothetical protein VTN31DRAFT_2423 [Thermomyces dupontii]|uniref:uncharacterized protein n=1 Tax=Talaromyces thermophilus TaxID=28565 RepID=UPI0037443407
MIRFRVESERIDKFGFLHSWVDFIHGGQSSSTEDVRSTYSVLQVEPNHQLMERIEGAIENLRSNAIATLVPNYTNQISSFSSIPCGPR